MKTIEKASEIKVGDIIETLKGEKIVSAVVKVDGTKITNDRGETADVEQLQPLMSDAVLKVERLESDDTDDAPVDPMVAKLTAIGGREWIKGDYHRVYFNEAFLCDLLEFDVDRYKTGNISSASFAGEAISNRKARGLDFNLSMGKVYYDAIEKVFAAKNMQNRDFDLLSMIQDRIEAKIG